MVRLLADYRIKRRAPTIAYHEQPILLSFNVAIVVFRWHAFAFTEITYKKYSIKYNRLDKYQTCLIDGLDYVGT